MTLSKAQQDVLDKLRSGWELGAGTDNEGRCWIQKGGIGRGGEAITISNATRRALERAGLVERGEWNFPTVTYRLVVSKS